jgi:hypothetical protein
MVPGASQQLLLSIAAAAVVALIVSTVVSWLLGPAARLRYEMRLRAGEARRRLDRTLELVQMQLKEEAAHRAMLEAGGTVKARWSLFDYERMMWPAVRALDDPDLDAFTRRRVRTAFEELLGPARLEYLSVLESPPSDYRDPVREPFEARFRGAGLGVFEEMFEDFGQSAPASRAIEKVGRLRRLLR